MENGMISLKENRTISLKENRTISVRENRTISLMENKYEEFESLAGGYDLENMYGQSEFFII